MALNAAVVWEIRTTGSDNNGGGFRAGAAGTDRSQQDSPHVVFDGSTITATTNAAGVVLTITGYTVVSGDVGNLLQITGGTNFTVGVYEITAVDTGANTWTIDRDSSSSGSGSAMTGNMGGAHATPGFTAGKVVSGNTVWQKSGTYDCSSTANVASGRVNLASGFVQWEGYGSSRGDLGTKPVLRATADTMTIFTAGTLPDYLVRNLEFQRNGHTAVEGFRMSVRGVAQFLKANDCNNTGIFVSAGTVIDSEATGCAGTNGAVGVQGTCHLRNLCSHDNASTCVGILVNNGHGTTLDRCVAKDDTGIGISIANSHSVTARCCDAVSNTGSGIHGFSVTSSRFTVLDRCIASKNGTTTGKGFNYGTGNTYGQLLNCQGYSNDGGDGNGDWPIVTNFDALSSDPFTNDAGDDLSLNNTAGGGADCKAIAETIPGLSTTSYLDSGAAQTDASGGGGGMPTLISARP